jgi:hypothetical protein
MLHVAFLLLLQAAAPEAPVLKGTLKDIPKEGKADPAVQIDVATNLPDGALVDVALYYGPVDEGKEIAKFVGTAKGGKFSTDLLPFPGSKKNLAGKYVARLRFNPALQNIAIPGFADHKSDHPLQIGNDADFQAESKAFRAQLAGEVQALMAIGEQVKTAMDAKKFKTPEEWKPQLREWGGKAVEIQVRASPLKVREYKVLGLDSIADAGLEHLINILNSAARHAAAGLANDAVEGLTRYRQTCEYWLGEITSPRLNTPAQLVHMIEAARGVIRDAISQSDPSVLFLRKQFVGMNATLQKSLPEELQPQVLEIGTRGAAFFNALADKEPNVKELGAELDKALEKLAVPIRALNK